MIVAVILMAGCTSAGEPPTTTPTPPGAPAPGGPEVLADLASGDCSYNDNIFLVPLSNAQALLPAGITAATRFTSETGVIVINFFECKSGAFAWSGADQFVIIEPPKLPEITETYDAANRTPRGGDALELDLYMLAAHTNHEELSALFERAGVPHAGGAISKSVTGPVAQGEVSDASGAIASYSTTLPPPSDSLVAHHRQWRLTEDAIVLFERFFSRDGAPIGFTLGPAACIVRADSLFAPALDGKPCQLAQDLEEPFGWTGRAYAFPGVTLESA